MTKILAALLIAAPLVATAQVRPDGPGRPGGPGGPPGEGRGRPSMGATPRDGAPREPGVTAMLNARRQLDLTPRQVAQLDSIERTLWTERERLRAQLEPQRDSMRASMRSRLQSGQRPDSATREALRREGQDRMARLRPQMQALARRDSVARGAADRILTDAQRGKWREMQAERRGFERGMRAGRGGRGGREGQFERGPSAGPGVGPGVGPWAGRLPRMQGPPPRRPM